MKNIRVLIAPFIAVIAIALQLLFGIELSEELQSDIASAIANIVAIGILTYSVISGQVKNKDKDKSM